MFPLDQRKFSEKMVSMGYSWEYNIRFYMLIISIHQQHGDNMSVVYSTVTRWVKKIQCLALGFRGILVEYKKLYKLQYSTVI